MPSVFSWREAHFAFGPEEFVKKKKKKRKQVDYLPLTRLALKTVPDPFHLGRKFFLFFYFILFIFFKFYFIFRLYITVLVLPNIKMNHFDIWHITFLYLNNIPFPLFLKKELGSKTSKAVATN